MAFPSQSGSGQSTTTAGTSHTINFPSGGPVAGLLLVALLRFSAAAGAITFTGWTPWLSDATDASDDDNRFFYRQSDGTEGPSDTLTTTNAVKLGGFALEITGAADPATQAPQTSTVAIGTGANADSTICTPTGGAKDYLWIVWLGRDGEALTATAPAGYGGTSTANSGTGGAAATNCVTDYAFRNLNAASENPAAWTSTAPNAGWTAYTIAVHPPAAAAALIHEPLRAMQAVNRSNVY